MTSLLTRFTLEENKGLVEELAYFRSMRLRLNADKLMSDESRQRILGQIDEVQRSLVKQLVRR